MKVGLFGEHFRNIQTKVITQTKILEILELILSISWISKSSIKVGHFGGHIHDIENMDMNHMMQRITKD